MIIYNSNFLNVENENGKILLNNKIKIFDSVKKIYEAISQKENIDDKKEIMKTFKSIYTKKFIIIIKIQVLIFIK